jgi:vancomycin resistance protein VanJ
MMFARIFRFCVFFAFGINSILLLIAVCCPWINPHQYWVPSFIGLFFKVLFLSHLFFALVFFIGSRKRALFVSVCIVLVCVPVIVHNSGFWFFGAKNIGGHPIKLMTWNINNFDFFNNNDTNARLILKTIKNEVPDIICFQEYMMNAAEERRTLAKLQKMGYRYYYEYITDTIPPQNRVGQAIFSKAPFLNIHAIPFVNTANGAFYVDIRYKKDTIRLFNVHFQSISLRPHEIKIPVSSKDFESPQKDYYRMLFVKIRDAFKTRSTQEALVKQQAIKSPYKVVLCGDFNDTPQSFVYNQMTEKLDDTFLRTGFGTGTTFAGMIPLQRIDYILADPSVKTNNTRVIHVPGSDHYPVVTEFSVQH